MEAIIDAVDRGYVTLALKAIAAETDGALQQEPEKLQILLNLAIEKNIMPLVKKLIEIGADVQYASPYGKTSLMFAETAEMTSLLLEAGAGVNAKDRSGFTALMRSKSSEITSLLLAAGADINVKSIHGVTALMRSKSGEMTSLLLKAGTSGIDARNFSGETALMRSKSGKITSLLLEAGANPNAKDKRGKIALMYSESSEITSLLLSPNANSDVNAKDNCGFTALMHSESSEITSLLLEAGAAVNAEDNDGFTPLMYSKSGEMTRLLLEAGADVNAKNNKGETALMKAQSGEIITLLLEAGANINAKDERGRGALEHYMRDYSVGQEQILYFLAHGAAPGEKTLKTAIKYDRDESIVSYILAAGANVEDDAIRRLAGRWPGKTAALLLAAGSTSWPSELEPTPQDLAEAGERLREARAELAAERSRVSLRAIRGRAAQVCIALQELELPALVTLHILEELDEKARSVRMGALWALITAVKHGRKTI